MRTIIKTTILGLGMSVMSINAFAATQTVSPKSTALLAAACTITAQSVSFGTLALPLYAQSASSNMNVLCSKEAPYKIDLTYGLSTNYWTFGPWGGRWDSSKLYYEMTEYDSSGKKLRVQNYYTSSGNATNTILAAAAGCRYLSDGKCHSTSSTSSSTSSGNMYGSKGDSVSYSIFVPGDNSKVWNIGINSYNSTGIGTSQTIPIRAQIVPGTSSLYPTPDMYTDTVIATVTY